MCFGGGGGSSSSSTAASNVNVEVNPEINVANIVDLKPVEKLIEHLAAAEQERTAATLIGVAASKAEIESRAGMTDTIKILVAAVAVGVAVMAARKR